MSELNLRIKEFGHNKALFPDCDITKNHQEFISICTAISEAFCNHHFISQFNQPIIMNELRNKLNLITSSLLNQFHLLDVYDWINFGQSLRVNERYLIFSKAYPYGNEKEILLKAILLSEHCKRNAKSFLQLLDELEGREPFSSFKITGTDFKTFTGKLTVTNNNPPDKNIIINLFEDFILLKNLSYEKNRFQFTPLDINLYHITYEVINGLRKDCAIDIYARDENHAIVKLHSFRKYKTSNLIKNINIIKKEMKIQI